MGCYDTTKACGRSGFRDIEIFNLALLARQAWRVLNDPELLSAQILKAAYFPASDILNAELGSHPSQIWQAILDGRDILAQGIIRRIGDGETTMIWEKNWIPREGVKRPITSLIPDPPLRVIELIDSSNARWREDVV